jgi:hypothetical protein
VAQPQGVVPPADRRPSMIDVAALAGVSHQTVSRVLNTPSAVRPDTRERVEAAIKELGYRRTPAPDPADFEEVAFDRTTWARESEQLRGKPWYRNYRYLALALLVFTVAVVVPFI